MTFDLSFYKGKRVLLTGHTGFKGAWMSQVLTGAGAELTGYSRGSEKDVSLFELAGLKDKLNHVTGGGAAGDRDTYGGPAHRAGQLR